MIVFKKITSKCEKDSEPATPQLTSHNLLVCFLNETPSDLEDEDIIDDTIKDSKVRTKTLVRTISLYTNTRQ